MLSQATIAQLAAELHESEKSRVQVEHFSKRFPEMTIEDGYAISREWVKAKIAEGRTVKGHKIGLTSRAMQQSSQIDEPDYGTLLDDMFFEQGGDIPFKRLIAPRIEVELAFVLGRKLQGPNVTMFDVLAATAYVVTAIEIIDARIEQFDRHTKAPRKVFDTISDNAANAGIVMGGRPVKPDAVDLRWVSALLFKNGVIEESGVAAAVLNHPANGVAWLANKLAPWDECLEAGEVVLGGSFTLEGTRPMLVEIQALVDNGGPSPRRLSVGLDRGRLAMLLAVLHRHAGVACMDQDVFVNAVGGVRISEPAADLAVMLAITSSLRGKPMPKGFIAFGEVGLAGEVRPAPRGQERLREAAKLGFSVAVVPKANAPKKGAKEIEGLTIHAVDRIEEAMDVVRRLD